MSKRLVSACRRRRCSNRTIRVIWTTWGCLFQKTEKKARWSCRRPSRSWKKARDAMSRTQLWATRRLLAVLKCVQIGTITWRWPARRSRNMMPLTLKKSTSSSCRRKLLQSKRKRRKMLQLRKLRNKKAQLSRKASDKSEWATGIGEAFSRTRRTRATTFSKAPSGHRMLSDPNASIRSHSHLLVPYTSSSQK